MYGLVVAWVRLDLGARVRRLRREWAYSLR
jgi:hypothetical protein